MQYSQSKLTQQELSELQRATHFDKKELQQWYKGTSREEYSSAPSCITADDAFPKSRNLIAESLRDRVSEGLPFRHAHQGRIPKDLPAVLPLW